MADSSGCIGANIIIDLSVESFQDVMRTTLNRQAQAAMADLDAAYRSPRVNTSQVHGVQVLVNISYNIRLLNTQADLEDRTARRNDVEIAQDMAQLNLDTVERVRENDYRDIDSDLGEETRQTQLSSVSRALDSLPVVSLNDLEQESQDCPVCRQLYPGSDLDEPDTPLLLRCNHTLGRACLERWILEHHNSCPICRAAIFDPDMFPVLADEEHLEAGEPERQIPDELMAAVERDFAEHMARRADLRRQGIFLES